MSAEFVTKMITFLNQGDAVGFRKFVEENIDQVDSSDVISTLKASRAINPTERELFDTLLYFFERCQAVGMAAAFDEWDR